MNTELNSTLQQADLLQQRLQTNRPLDVEALQKIKAALVWGTNRNVQKRLNIKSAENARLAWV